MNHVEAYLKNSTSFNKKAKQVGQVFAEGRSLVKLSIALFTAMEAVKEEINSGVPAVFLEQNPALFQTYLDLNTYSSQFLIESLTQVIT